ncbi:MAG: hypothetical protein MZV63_35295 [Marinilabiliales bacterium]|nr:hypothetical protein [Marinilabiliales bacterium]
MTSFLRLQVIPTDRLLGLYSFGLFTRRSVNDRVTPWIAIMSPVLCYFLSMYSEELFNGYRFGFEMLLVNGFLTFMGLLIFSHRHGFKACRLSLTGSYVLLG